MDIYYTASKQQHMNIMSNRYIYLLEPDVDHLQVSIFKCDTNIEGHDLLAVRIFCINISITEHDRTGWCIYIVI